MQWVTRLFPCNTTQFLICNNKKKLILTPGTSLFLVSYHRIWKSNCFLRLEYNRSFKHVHNFKHGSNSIEINRTTQTFLILHVLLCSASLGAKNGYAYLIQCLSTKPTFSITDSFPFIRQRQGVLHFSSLLLGQFETLLCLPMHLHFVSDVENSSYETKRWVLRE